MRCIYWLPITSMLENTYPMKQSSYCDVHDKEYESKTGSRLEDASGKTKISSVTEYIRVPSSEHVASIAGRRGRKIKSVGSLTGTSIETATSGEESIFVIKGKKENVARARMFIESGSKQFSETMERRNESEDNSIVASLRALVNPSSRLSNASSPDLFSPATITLKVKVPYKLIGLVVGAKGSTIRRIQQETHTRIVTPRENEGLAFKVTGFPVNAEKAKDEIYAHIDSITGNLSGHVHDDFSSNGTVVEDDMSFSDSQSTCTPFHTSNVLGEHFISMPRVENHLFDHLKEHSFSYY